VLSQPLCTAVQILQVDFLRSATVEFDVVVGHSFGEINMARDHVGVAWRYPERGPYSG
jgi:hypothetical protein